MENKQKGLNISARSFIAAIVIIFLLMLATYILTFVVPGGTYTRIPDENGNMVIDAASGFISVKGGLPFWKWILSPLLVLGADGSAALIAVIVFLLVIGGVFNALTDHGLMNHMLDRLTQRFGGVRYRLMAVLILFFMAMGSLVGSFEEIVPLVPIVVSLAVSLGWDAQTGVAMSLLAVGCGFAAGVANPFTIGVAQTLAGLPMFSGIWLRLLSFVCIYFLLLGFVSLHARRHSRTPAGNGRKTNRKPDRKMDAGLRIFAVLIGLGIAGVLASGFVSALRDYTMIIVAVMFLIAGISSCLVSGMTGSELRRSFFRGVVAVSPSVLMILMAASIKYPLRFRESFPSDPADCPSGPAFRHQPPALYRRLCLRRWLQQRLLPHKSRPADFPGTCKCKLRQVGRLLLEVPGPEPFADLRPAPARPCTGLCITGRCDDQKRYLKQD